MKLESDQLHLLPRRSSSGIAFHSCSTPARFLICPAVPTISRLEIARFGGSVSSCDRGRSMASSARRTLVRLRLPVDGRLAQEGRAAFHTPCLHDHEPQDPPEVGPRSPSDLSSLSWPPSSGAIRRFSSPNTTTSFASSVLLQHRMVSSQAAQAQPSQVAGSSMQSANETEEAAEKVGRKLSIGSQKASAMILMAMATARWLWSPPRRIHLSIESPEKKKAGGRSSQNAFQT